MKNITSFARMTGYVDYNVLDFESGLERGVGIGVLEIYTWKASSLYNKTEALLVTLSI